MKRGDLKEQGKSNVKKHYWVFVLLCLIAAFIGAEFQGTLSAVHSFRTVDADLTADGVNLFNGALNQAADSVFGRTNGVFADVLNAYYSGSIGLTVANVVEGVTNSADATHMIMIIGAAFIYFMFIFFVIQTFLVASRRVFLEGRIYDKVSFYRIFYLFRIQKFMNIVKAMAVLFILKVLWLLTVVGGFIKYYSYRLVPYLLAENPDLKPLQAITLSRRMMDGHKWECFILDLSFLGWGILSVLSFGLVGIFYVNPYKQSTMCEFYAALRELARESKIADADTLKDIYLYQKADEELLNSGYEKKLKIANPVTQKEVGIRAFLYQNLGIRIGNDPKILEKDARKVIELEDLVIKAAGQGESYPTRLGLFPEKEKHLWAETHNYLRSYSLTSLILIFFTMCMIGWVWEVTQFLILDGTFIKRGVLHGPWLPIYGVGAVLILTLLYRFRKTPTKNFGMIVLICGLVEYYTSFFLQLFFNAEWWDYSGYFLNINGRICAEGSLVFGLGGMMIVYVLAPFLDTFFKKFSFKVTLPLCMALILLFGADLTYSYKHPNTGKDITDYSSMMKQEKIEIV
ncbi:DUF975 family protein [Eubacteriaceae bacterium ES2]|nr:DUF975 family protein [Eubacteriaceae bacterium ES2]